MANHWTSKYAILRDLSVAQGKEVPAEIDNTVTMDERPPRLNFTEETEENFFENCVGNGYYNSGPDLELIQQMLQEVSTPVDLSIEEGIEHIKIRKSLPKNRKRNVAVASLVKMYGDIQNGDSLSDSEFHENANRSNTKAAKTPGLWLPNSANMFRKKTFSPTILDNSPTPQKSTPEKYELEVPIVGQPSIFVPSSRASEYYNKYIKQSEVQEQVQEDIWSRAEKQMKELDGKRKQKSGSKSVNVNTSNSETLTGLDLVRLPQHRHLMTENCVVCEVLVSKVNKD